MSGWGNHFAWWGFVYLLSMNKYICTQIGISLILSLIPVMFCPGVYRLRTWWRASLLSCVFSGLFSSVFILDLMIYPCSRHSNYKHRETVYFSDPQLSIRLQQQCRLERYRKLASSRCYATWWLPMMFCGYFWCPIPQWLNKLGLFCCQNIHNCETHNHPCIRVFPAVIDFQKTS